MVNILVLFHSSQGSVRNMAYEIAETIESCGAQARLRTFVAQHDSDITVSHQDLLECDALAFGSPTRFGMMAAAAKQFWDSTSELWLKGALIDKPATVFTSSSSLHGGNEATLLGMALPLLHHGMMLLGVPYDTPELHSTQAGGTPYGASHVAGLTNSSELTEDERKICVSIAKRLTRISNQLQ